MKRSALIFILVIILGLFFFGLNSSLADVNPTANPPIEFTNPIQATSVQELLMGILSTLQGVIVVISLIFIVIGAIIYITSGGSEKQITTGKNAITAALVGLAIGIAAPSFLKQIAEILGWTGTDAGLSDALSLTQIATNVLSFLLSIVGILALITLIIGASMYFGAGANEKSVESAKKIILYSIIGITIAMASMLIVKQVANFFVA